MRPSLMISALVGLACGALAFWAALAKTEASTKIVVRDDGFTVVKVITSASELQMFDRRWSEKIPEADGIFQPRFKLDILRNDRSVRWLYDPLGLVQLLTKRKTPVYRLPSASDFNALLAISASGKTLR
jgi:hypothetical protein